MITIEHDRNDYIVCRVSGTLTKADYDAAVPELENAMSMRESPTRLLIMLEDFRGWYLDGLWEELRFDVKHKDDFGKVAVVGESALEEWATRLTKPFSGAATRYFDRGDKSEAAEWLTQ